MNGMSGGADSLKPRLVISLPKDNLEKNALDLVGGRVSAAALSRRLRGRMI